MKIAVLILLMVCLSTNATDAKPLLTKIYAPEHCELRSPAFIGASDKIVVVSKRHEPDGHEAESFTEEELRKFSEYNKEIPRRCDPRIVVLSNGLEEFIDFGWNSTPDADGSHIYYSHQVQPITGFRELASTQEGNKIRCYNISDKISNDIFTTEHGYVDSVLIAPDGKKIAYTICDAANGAYGMKVGVGIYDVESKTSELVVPPRRKSDQFTIYFQLVWIGSELFAVSADPENSDHPIAKRTSVVNISRGAKPLYTHEVADVFWGAELKAIADHLVVIKNSERITMTTDGKILKTEKITEGPDSNRWSSNEFTATSKGNKLVISDNHTGKKQTITLPGTEISTVTWSNGQKKLAAVTVHDRKLKYGSVFDHCELIVVDMSRR